MTWIETASLAASAATVIAALGVIITALIIGGQLYSMRKTRELESLLVIMKYVDDVNLRKARYFIYEHAQEFHDLFSETFSWEKRHEIDTLIRKLSSGEVTIHDVDLSLNALNNICYLIRFEYAPSDAVRNFMNNTLLHAWGAFKPYVYHRRSRPDTIGRLSRYADHFEWVYENKCKTVPNGALPLAATLNDV